MSCVYESQSIYWSPFEVLARALQPESPSFGPHMRIIGVRALFSWYLTLTVSIALVHCKSLAVVTDTAHCNTFLSVDK